MSSDSAHLDQAVARALRANLEGMRRQSEELHQAIADLVAACSSSRPSNALPHIIRAQASAASVEAVLEVLAKFITRSAQSSRMQVMEEDYAPPVAAVSTPAFAPARPAAPERPAPSIPAPMNASPAPIAFEAPAPPAEIESDSSETIEIIEPPAPEPAHIEPEPVSEEPARVEAAPDSAEGESADHESIWKAAEQAVSGKGATPAASPASVSKDAAFFDISTLPAEQQEMHRRASRVAKVSMQDIKLLQPEAVKKGRETKDICIRLKDEIEKARKEYERRFRPILGQGVDYFHHWMVEVLGAGDESALGEYPYHPAMRQ